MSVAVHKFKSKVARAVLNSRKEKLKKERLEALETAKPPTKIDFDLRMQKPARLPSAKVRSENPLIVSTKKIRPQSGKHRLIKPFDILEVRQSFKFCSQRP